MDVDAGQPLRLLESQDLHTVAQIESVIKDNLQTNRESWLLNSLVEFYLVSQSKNCMEILATVQEPHDRQLMDRILEHVKGGSTNRLQALTLFAYIVRRQPCWLYKVAQHSLMSYITKCLKNDSDVPVLMCGVLIIVSIIPIIPVAITSHLHDIFEAFSRLVAFNNRKPGNVPDVYLLHLQVAVYALFHRLYGMYPCNFLTYLRATYSKPENKQVFEEFIKPMLERVRMHPLLVTASKDKELATERWRHKEVHDIMVECAKMSLDPIEGWSEESLGPVISPLARQEGATIPSLSSEPPASITSISTTSKPQESWGATTTSLFSSLEPFPSEALTSALQTQDPFWSPSTVCGLSTPPPLPVTSPFPDAPTTTLGSVLPTSFVSHVDSPLPHDETERRRLAMLNTHLNVQIEAHADVGVAGSSNMTVPPSPLKPDFTSEPPHNLSQMRAIRKINFDLTLPPSAAVAAEEEQQLAAATAVAARRRGPCPRLTLPPSDVMPAEEAKEDMIASTAQPVQPSPRSAEPVPDGTERLRNQGAVSSSVPSVSELSQFIDSLDVDRTSQDKMGDEDLEVSELTQDGLDDEGSTSGSGSDCRPSHLPSTVEMTSESVQAFMKKVNRIRFNSMNVNQERPERPKPSQYSRSNSCPNLKDKAAQGIEEATEEAAAIQEGTDAEGAETGTADSAVPRAPPVTRSLSTVTEPVEGVRVTTPSTTAALAVAAVTSVAGSAPSTPHTSTSGHVMTQMMKVTTTIQTQTSVRSTSSVEVDSCGPQHPESEEERFYRNLMTILLPPPSYCSRCCQRDLQHEKDKGQAQEKPQEQPGRLCHLPNSAANDQKATANGHKIHSLDLPLSVPPILSPGGAPIYTTLSPPEMLDRHILFGGDLHAHELAKIPLTSQGNVSWTHFGGVPPADEVTILRGQLLLIHNQLMFERHKSELHAKRNRRLLGRTVKTAALEEQNAAMQDQLRLQENEIQHLSEALKAQQQQVADLRADNDKHTCERQVLEKSHAKEVESLRSNKEALESQLQVQMEENERLRKELQGVRSQMFCVEQELQASIKKVGHTNELEEQVTRLNKELLLMGELQQKYQQRLVAMSHSHHSKPETQFILDSYKAELAAVRITLDQKNTLLDSFRARLQEGEEHVIHKDLMLAEEKRMMEHLRAQHKGEIQALEEKYRAQKRIQLGLHAQILDLYGQVTRPGHQPAQPECQDETLHPEETSSKAYSSITKVAPESQTSTPTLGGSIKSQLSSPEAISVLTSLQSAGASASAFKAYRDRRSAKFSPTSGEVGEQPPNY